MAVINLTVPRPWQVGTVTIEPYGELRSRIDAYVASSSTHDASKAYGRLLKTAADLNAKWATARVAAASFDQATSLISDAIDALRLYRRARYRFISTDRQLFGLPGEFISDRQETFVEQDGVFTTFQGKRI